MSALYLAGAVLLAVAALAVWVSFRDPVFVTGLTAAAVGAIVRAVLPTVLRSSPETQARAQQAAREGRLGDLWGGREK